MPDLMWYWQVLIVIGGIHFMANLWSTQVLFEMEDDWSFPMFILFLFIGWPIYMAIILFGLEDTGKE